MVSFQLIQTRDITQYSMAKQNKTKSPKSMRKELSSRKKE